MNFARKHLQTHYHDIRLSHQTQQDYSTTKNRSGKMTQKYVEMYANTLITVTSSEDENPGVIIRKTPHLEEIPILISSSDDSDLEISQPKTTPNASQINNQKKEQTRINSSLTEKSPAAKIIDIAFKKLGINEKTPPSKHRLRKNRIFSIFNNIQPYIRKQTEIDSSTYNPYNKNHQRYQFIRDVLYRPKKITIALEGNIGIGKSTLLKKLQSLGPPHMTTIYEPVKQWTNNNRMNLLDHAYSNPRKWSFIFQNLVMTNSLQNHVGNGSYQNNGAKPGQHIPRFFTFAS